MSPGFSSDPEYSEIALTKMTAVLGPTRAQSLLREICETNGITLATADELFEFGEALSRVGGFEGAVGALLTVRAIMRGARGR